MEFVKETIFSNLKFPTESEINIKNKVLYITKWNWDYQECLLFQKKAQELIRSNRDHKVYIFTNHPHCFTLGRGNERGQNELVDFDPALEERLKFPIHKIHRGGGITFHFPGQWIFYPIVSINQKYSLDDHMCWMLKSVKDILRDEFGLEKAMAAKKLMGVWLGRQKLASIGVGLNRFVTEHGLALNLVQDSKMFDEVKKINPCGINPTTYISLNEVLKNTEENLIQQFHKLYIKKLNRPIS
ncbi:MAG: lipoate-protein ligase B [Bacteriovoracaceae bacterium]